MTCVSRVWPNVFFYREPHFSERKNGLLGLDGLQCRAVNYLDSDKKTCQESLEVQLRTLMQITESKHKEVGFTRVFDIITVQILLL